MAKLQLQRKYLKKAPSGWYCQKKINAQDLAAPQLHKFRLEASNPQIIESIKPTLNLKNNSVFCRPHGLWTIMHVKTWTSEFRNQLIDRILSLNK